jgi:AraC-like DNA-binding protein
MARPRKEIDEKQVFKLAKILCTDEEIAAVLNCSSDTLVRRFAEPLEKGRQFGRQSLRRKQYQLAMKGDRTMLVWLGKQYLGQQDRVQQEHTGGIQLSHSVSDAMRELLCSPDALAAARTIRSRAQEPVNGNGHANGNGRH